MNYTTFVRRTGVTLIIILVLAVGYRSVEQQVGPASETPREIAALPVATKSTVATQSPAATHPDFLYGRVTTVAGITYQGRMRFGGDEEAFWGNYFNGAKDENPWAAYVTPARLSNDRRTIDFLGLEISLGKRRVALDRPFMARFGDIARIDAVGDGVRAAFERGLNYSPEIRVTLKSGTVVDLDRFEADDFADGLRIWDAKEGVVNLREQQVRTIEFLSPAQRGPVPDRLYGTVHTGHGNFTGFLQWDREETLGDDQLVGHTADEELALRFDAIRSIAKQSASSSLVTLVDGRDVVLSDSRKVGRGNRGVYVDDQRYGRVLVSWDAFERVDFSPAGSGPSYDDFPPGQPITGSVTTRAGRRFAGRLVYDLDESEITETLDAPYMGVHYTIPFGLVDLVTLPDGEKRDAGSATVALHSGEELKLEYADDLGDGNAGMLIFGDGRERPTYVPWTDVEKVEFDRPAVMYPSVGGRQNYPFTAQ